MRKGGLNAIRDGLAFLKFSADRKHIEQRVYRISGGTEHW